LKKELLFFVIVLTLLCGAAEAQSWIRKGDFPGIARDGVISFTIGNYGYYGNGIRNLGADSIPDTTSANMWRYDPKLDSWTTIAPLPQKSTYSEAFSIDSFGYVKNGIIGLNPSNLFYQYSPLSNSWSVKANFPDNQSYDAGSFVLNGKAYIFGGKDTSSRAQVNTCYAYLPATDTWTQEANLPAHRRALCGFSLNGTGYAALGFMPGDTLSKNIYKYDAANNLWSALTDFPGNSFGRRYGHFILNNEVYFSNDSSQVWKYNPVLDQWKRLPDAPFSFSEATFVLNGIAYIVESVSKAVWQFCPETNLEAGPDIRLCKGNSIQLNATGGLNYTWSPSTDLSDTTISNPIASPSQTTAYRVRSTSLTGCSNSDTLLVSVKPLPLVHATSARNVICPGDTTSLHVNSGVTYSWAPAGSLTNPDTENPIASPAAPTHYSVSIMDSNGCISSDSVWVKIYSVPTILGTSSPSSVCLGDTSLLQASGASTYSWSPAMSLSSSTGVNVRAYPSVPTTYTLTGTDTNGCINTSLVSLGILPLPPIPTISVNTSVLTSDAVSGNQWYLNGKMDGVGLVDTAKENGIYMVCATSSQGCTSCSAPLNFNAEGIIEPVFCTSFSIYPNPATSYFSIDYTLFKDSELNLELYALTGEKTQTMYDGFANSGKHSLKIPITGLAKGVYFVRLRGLKAGTFFQRLIVIE
jgi:hypothetical protein